MIHFTKEEITVGAQAVTLKQLAILSHAIYLTAIKYFTWFDIHYLNLNIPIKLGDNAPGSVKVLCPNRKLKRFLSHLKTRNGSFMILRY